MVNGDCTKPQHRVLRYLMVPTPEKPCVDEKPYVAKPSLIPTSLVDEAAKSKARFLRKQANPDEVFGFLRANVHIKSYDDLLTYLGNAPDSDLVAKRVSKFVNNNILRAKDIIGGLIARRDYKAAKEESAKKPI